MIQLRGRSGVVITNTYMKAVATIGVAIVLAAATMLAGCGAGAVQVPLSPALANDLIGTTTVSSAPVGPISESTLAPAAWEEAPEAPVEVAPAPTWGDASGSAR